MLDEVNIPDLLRRGSLCRDSCEGTKSGTATITSHNGTVYTSVRAVCPNCKTRVGIAEGTDGYRRVVVTPGGSSAKAQAAGRQKEEWIVGVASDPESVDEVDMQATFDANLKNITGLDAPKD